MTQKLMRRTFTYAISITVAVVAAKVFFLAVIISLSGITPKDEMIASYMLLLIAISTSIYCGIIVYKKIFKYIDKEMKNL
jgi:hypothetical protein